MGARPIDVKGNDELQFSLNFKAGQQQRELTHQLQTHASKLEELGAFRTLLPKTKFEKTDRARWSAEVHPLASVKDGFAIGKDGTKERVRFALPVSSESKSVKLPGAVAGGDSAKDQFAREKLKPYIEGLLAHIGERELSLQDAGNFLGTLPGWRAAVTELRKVMPA